MKKSILILSILVLVNFATRAQILCSNRLSGHILDEQRLPLTGATVYILEVNRGKVCDVNGFFEFTELCSGAYTIEIKFVGYATRQIKINLTKNERVEVQLLPDEKLLNEVVIEDHIDLVSKTANSQSLSGVALEATSGKSLGEALQNITGVNTIQSGPAIFKPVIHGVHSQRILILNNGVRQEGQQWGADHAPEIDPFIATKIVVVKDASAIRYGTDALGGVVIVTPAELPTDQKIGGQIHVLGATNGRSGVLSGMLEGGFKNNSGWGWRMQGTAKQSGDMHAASYNLSNTGFKELNYSLSTGYHKGNKGFEVYFSRFNTTIGILRGSVVGSTQDLADALEKEPPQYTEPFTYQIAEPRQEVIHNLLKLTGHVRKGNDLFNLRYGFQLNNRKEFDVRRGTLKNIPALGYDLYTQTLDLEWERTLSNTHTRAVGMNGLWQDNNKIDGTQTIPFIPNYTSLSGGLYWIERLSKDKWDAEFGARYDLRFYDVVGFDFANKLYRTSYNFKNVSATAAATYQFTSNSSITSSIGSAWRPPNVAELYSLGTHQSAASIEYGLLLDETTNQVNELSDIDFNSEQALKWVNTYRYHKNKFNVEVVGYINYIFNYIYLRPRGVTQNVRGIFPYFRYTQTDASFIGSDILIGQELFPGLLLQGRISLLRAADVTNNDYLIFIPPNRYEVLLRYNNAKVASMTNLFAEVKLRYVAKQTRAPRVVSIPTILEAKEQGIDLFENDYQNFDFVDSPDAYFLTSVSGGISRPFSNSKMELRVSVENLTNTAFREYSNRMRYYADDLGRNFSIALKYSF
ncbi:MAG: TonB-dependent receptor [Ignavibacteriaceae bacterium]|nr:TonB-dependent receptor [Ignavibacteriaceae bacterium]MCU0367616.1 TonB-dependent receptor [Cyclobacteriaceae bacterium]